MAESAGDFNFLPASFFARPTLEVASDLLGKFLVRRTEEGEVIALPIHEVEAYDGFEDRASHAHRGVTPRTSVMFGPPGHFYVYLCYGMHWLLNVVTGPEGYPAAVLLRGAGPFVGPARLTRGLAVNGSQNRAPAIEATGLWFEDRGVVPPVGEVEKTPRIGVAYAGPEWAAKPYRFLWDHVERKTARPKVRRNVPPPGGNRGFP
jgi:DNA-3-methyladenine glycosylase